MLSSKQATTNPHQPASRWFPANLEQLSRRFEQQHPRDVMRWALTTFGEDIALATGFGPSGIVLMHMVSQLRPDTTIFYLQTDLLFPETMRLISQLASRLGLQFTQVHCRLSLDEQDQAYGPELWWRNADLCCLLRKVAPLRRFLVDKRAWITAIRRDQSPTRAGTKIVAWDRANELTKVCPLAGWTQERVWAYLQEHQLPYNELHDQGYPSIGCIPCTRPVSAGEDERAGRWAGTGKLECGIHIQSDGWIIRNADQNKTN